MWPILHNHVSLSVSIHSFTILVSYAHFFFFFWVTFDLGNYDSFIHYVLSLLNLFVIKELSFCMWMFCFMKWAVLLWFLLFILLCYSVKLGKYLFVYMWIWFGIWCLLLSKANFFFFFFNFVYEFHGVEWEAKSKEEEEIVNSSPLSYLLFGAFNFLLIPIFVLYWKIKCFFFSLFYYGLPALPFILLLTIIPIFVSLWFHMFEEMPIRRANKKNDNHISWIILIILLVNLIDKWVFRTYKNCSCVFH